MSDVIDDLRLLRDDWNAGGEDDIGLQLKALAPRRRATLAIRRDPDVVVALRVERIAGELPPTLPESSANLIVKELPMDDGGSWIEVTAPISHVGPFSALAAYGLNSARNAEPNGPQGLLHAIDELRDLFERPATRPLDSKRLAALYAELRVLEALIDAGVDGALALWTGPDEEPHDFTGLLGGDIEVKSTLSPDRTTVMINGIDQLDSPEGGDLLLLVMRLERDHSDKADRLRSLISRIEPHVDEVAFLRKLAGAGYDFSDNGEDESGSIPSREPAFLVIETMCHRVDANFPRLVPSNLVEGALADGTDRLRYRVDLEGLKLMDADWVENVRAMAT